MLKNGFRPVLVILIILIFITQCPVSAAEQYGDIRGRVLDKYGHGVPDVTLQLQNGDYKIVATTMSGADGSYAFNQVASPSGADLYRILSDFETGGNTVPVCGFFEVLALRINTRDIHFDNYPPSNIGGLYGIVTNDQNLIIEVPATIYLDNGMYLVYGGARYDQWKFEKLPAGKYVVRAETNIGGETYTSKNYNVTVTSDQDGYVPIYLPTYSAGTNKVPYHAQPVPMKNIVHGAVLQKNGIPYAGAKADLYRVSAGGQQYVASATTNQTGQYVFDGVSVSGVSEQFLVRVTYEVYGAPQTKDSGTFTVFYANTLGASHDINVPVSLDFVNSGSINVASAPSGARISIDGVDTGYYTPYNLTGLLAGSHAIGLSLEGYYNDNFTVQLQPDATVSLDRTLKISTGSSYLDVRPAGAAVYVDGEYAGASPLNLTQFPAGTHTYRVTCDGYLSESGTIEIVPGEAISKEIDLVAAPGLSLTYIGYLIGSFIQQIFSLF